MNPAVGAIEAVSADLAPAAVPATEGPAAGFGTWFTKELESVNSQLVQAERGVQELASGAVVNVHDTMLQLEQARLAFQLAIQVRSRVLEAYQEVMRMQV